jgi:hypothetical protein
LSHLLDDCFWWIGLVTFTTGGFALALWIQWSLLEIICRYLGWNKTILKVARQMMIQKRDLDPRADRPAN